MLKTDRASLFAALGDPIRLELLARMQDDSSITRLADGLPITRQAVTRHLHVLEGAKLIKAQRRGREMHFVVCPARLSQAKDWLDEVTRQWDGTLERLQNHVETQSR